MSAPSLRKDPVVLVFDSGIGGLSVQGEIAARLPQTETVFVADDAGFPYGAWDEAALTARVADLVGRLVAAISPDIVVVACNTASTLVLPTLRAALAVPVVGTVPAIKPAAERTKNGLVSVLATPGTVARDYTRALVETHARGVDVTLVGSSRLAALAEARLRGLGIDEAAIAEEIAPCFVERDGRRTDAVVLACTHYPFLADVFARLAPWPVAWIDPSPAIARRTVEVLGLAPASPAVADAAPAAARPGRAIFTSGNRPEPALEAALTRRHLAWDEGRTLDGAFAAAAAPEAPRTERAFALAPNGRLL